MIVIIKNEKDHAVLYKEYKSEKWGNCSDDNLRKILNRTEPIDRVRFEDYHGIADRLNIYFEQQ